MKSLLSLPLSLLLLSASAQALELNSLEQRYGYTMGVRIGQLLQSQNVGGIDAAAFAAAVDDVLQGRELKLSGQQMVAAIQERQAQEQAKRAAAGEANRAKGEAFLAANAKKPGVITRESGLQYQVLKSGSGDAPKPGAKVKVHYRGTLIDGTEFDSSYARGEPAVFALDGVIPGFSEAIGLMQPGAKWQVFIPGALAYGERGAGNDIGPNETLIFEIELLEAVK